MIFIKAFVKSELIIVVCLLLASEVFSQSATTTSTAKDIRVDSAMQVLRVNKGNAKGMNTLFWLAQTLATEDPQQALTYLNDALVLAKKLSATESIIKIYNELGLLYHGDGQYDSSLFFHRQALRFCGDQSRPCSEAYQGLAVNLLWLSVYDSAKYFLLKAEIMAKANSDYEDLAGIYNTEGNVFLQERNYQEALTRYIRSAKIQDSALHDPLGQSRALANIGNVQYIIGDYDKALTYAKEAQEISINNNFQKNIAYLAQLIGRIYRKQKKMDEALLEYNKALEVYLKMNFIREASETYSNIGNIYFDKGDFISARNQYEKALRISKKSDNNHLLGSVYAAMGYAYFHLKQYKVAVAYLDSAQHSAKKTGDAYTILDSYEVLTDIYTAQNNYKDALTYYQLFTQLKDSLTETSNLQKIQELELSYQNERKAGEIELLKSNQQVQSLTLSRQRLIITAIAILLLSSIAIGFLLVNRYRVMHKTQRLLEIEKVRNNLARDLHDDIGSTLSSINILSRVALSEKNENVQHYLQRIGDQSARIMEDIGDMVWSVNPHNDAVREVIAHMREFASEMLESNNMDYEIRENISPSVKLTPEQRKNLFLIFKEAVNNAAKYSHAKHITITLTQEDRNILLSIQDNGNGFNEQHVKSGNGLRNQRERAAELNGKLTIKSEPGEGTLVALKIPIA